MKLILEHSETVFDIPQQGGLRIGNDEGCQVQIDHPEILNLHATISNAGYGHVLQIESIPIMVNGTAVKSCCMLYPGDELKLADWVMMLVDDDYIPKAVSEPQQFKEAVRSEELSSVFGLRHLTGEQSGAFIKSDYHHQDGWHIYRTDSQLALISNNNKVFVNGQQVGESAWLNNGDRIHYHGQWFNVECPGHSGYSKFSPSHPRNVMLSESLTEESDSDSHQAKALRPHYWWITLLIGLGVLVAVILLR
ncbi:MAG: FHA domain-containing protein [Proteobacteria bacterium]|nr:MAG: FHA domain-containing protein [Pseudomonadota bacterium]